MGIISRIVGWLPGIGPALGAFLNPWIWVAILAASSAAFLYGNHLGNVRVEALQDAAQKVLAAQKAIVKVVVVQQKVVDKETVDDLKRRNAQLARDNDALFSSLQHHIQSLGGTVSSTAPGDASVDQGRLDKAKSVEGLRTALQRFVDGYRSALNRGDITFNLLTGCYEFTERQHQVTNVSQPVLQP